MRILVVDDSRTITTVFGARLVEVGHEVVIAENGQIAVERFQASAPDLVLMDIEMPVMNGFEAAKQIRAVEATQEWAWTPIIFLTASDTPENLITAIEAGGDDFIPKSAPESVVQAKMKAMARIAALRAELSLANRKLAAQASQDGLTGLFNRRYMDLRLDHQWSEAIRCGASFGLLMMDVDHFKQFNDHYGHLAGDDCLRAIAATLQKVVEEVNARRFAHDAFVARYGGEELAMMLPRCNGDVFAEIARATVDAVRREGIPHVRNAEWGVSTLSVGGAFMGKAEGKLSPLFRQADANLYRAKQNGRNRAELG